MIDETYVNDEGEEVHEDTTPINESTVTRSGRSVIRHNYGRVNKYGFTYFQSMRVSRKKAAKGERKKLVINCKDSFRSIVGIVMAQMKGKVKGSEYEQIRCIFCCYIWPSTEVIQRRSLEREYSVSFLSSGYIFKTRLNMCKVAF